MGLALTAHDVEALEARTEGWIAALQLAALSLQGRADVGDFIAGFSGDDRYIVDYLVEEVLQRQPEHVQRLPVADLHPGPAERPALRRRHRSGRAGRRCWPRWSAATCSWWRSTTAAGGIAITTSSPTSCRRTCWTSSPTSWPTCTGGRASGMQQNGDPSEAIRHALAAEDFARAADLVELDPAGAAQGTAGGHPAQLARGAARRA